MFAKKSLGQNFLIDKNIINKIVSVLNIQNKNIVEIGSGKGALTDTILSKRPKSLLIIEKDKELYDHLKIKYRNLNYITILNSDILKIDLEKIIRNNSIIFGNLPYNISSQILVKLIKFKKWPPKFTNLILMFQKEVAEKIIGKSYGRLSIISGLRLNFLDKFEISPNCFTPKPKVKSTVVHMIPKKVKFKIKDLNNLEKTTNIFFSNKRKMINKSLKKILKDNQIAKIEKKYLNLRPENLKPQFYYKLVELIEKG